MDYKIICKSFQSKEFKTGGPDWDKRISLCIQLAEGNPGTADLFYSLAQEGVARTCVWKRAEYVVQRLGNIAHYALVVEED